MEIKRFIVSDHKPIKMGNSSRVVFHCISRRHTLMNVRKVQVFPVHLNSTSVDKEGNVCISILHEPGDDRWGYEKPEERWLPVHTVETILLSVISMLADPNHDSPANVDAAVGFIYFWHDW